MKNSPYIESRMVAVLLLMGGCALTEKIAPSIPAPATPAPKNEYSQEKSSKKQIMKDYLIGVEKSDGINEKEAVLLAQSHLILRGLDKTYFIDRPEIVFEDELHFGINFNPINKILGEYLSQSNITFVVNKKTGEIKQQKGE